MSYFMEQPNPSELQAQTLKTYYLQLFLGICCRHKKDILGSLELVAIAYPL